eukprot:5744258-Amphidinium_carterae.1
MFDDDRQPTHEAGRTIDHSLHASCVTTAVKMAQTDTRWRFPSHKAIFVHWDIDTLLGSAPPDNGVKLNVPRKLPIAKEIAAIMRRTEWHHLKCELDEALGNNNVNEALRLWTSRWELATLHGAALCETEVEITPSMAGRAHGEILVHPPAAPPIPKHRSHMPLKVRQIRRTWSLMKTCLMDHTKAVTFLELVRVRKREAAILRRATNLHGVSFAFVSAVSIATMRELLIREEQQVQHTKLNAWKQQMQNLGPACRYVRASFISHGLATRDLAGNLHVGYEAKSEQLRLFWQDVCKPKNGHTLNSVSKYVRQRLFDVAPGQPFTIPDIGIDDIRWAARRTKKTSSPGPGAWRIDEIHQLPDQAIQEMANIYNKVLSTGVTPDWWKQSWTSFIPKAPDSIDVACQRPITVTPMLWRLFARIVNRTLTDHVDARLLECQHGARRGRNGIDPALNIKAFGDAQRRAGGEAHLLQLDIAKCFNNLNPADAIAILRHHGLDSRIAGMLFHHYTMAATRNKMAPDWGGVSYQCERGCPQGCPISVTLANVLLALVPMAPDKSVACSMFLDDTSLYSENKVKLARAAAQVKTNIESLALEIQDAKCCYVNLGSLDEDGPLEPLRVNNTDFEATRRTQLLGFDVHATRVDLPHRAQATRAEVARERLARVDRLPSQRSMKQCVMNAMVTSLWRWAPGEPLISANYRTAMRRAALDAVEGTPRPWETAYEILAAALLKGHQLDCCWAQAHSALLLYHRAITLNEELALEMFDDEVMPGSMLDELSTLLKAMGLARERDLVVSGLCDARVRITVNPDNSKMAHDFREMVRKHLLTALALRRPNEFGGCADGIKAEWMRHALTVSTSKPKYAALRRFFLGSFLCRERQSRHAGGANSKVSPFCSMCGELDTIHHIVECCVHLPNSHRRYLEKVSDPVTKQLLTRTAIPRDTEELNALGQAEYTLFTQHLAAALVRRNILNAEAEQWMPAKRRLVTKQPRPQAYYARGTSSATARVSKRGPNAKKRADMTYRVEDDGFWHVNAHLIMRLEEEDTVTLRCVECLRTACWEQKHIFVLKVCDGRKRTIHKDHLKGAPEHITHTKGALACTACGGVGTTKHTVHFLKKHAKCK